MKRSFLFSALLIVFSIFSACQKESLVTTTSSTELATASAANVDNPQGFAAGLTTASVITITAQPTTITWGQVFGISVTVTQNGKPLNLSPVTVTLYSGSGSIPANSRTITDANGKGTISLILSDVVTNTTRREALGKHIFKINAGGVDKLTNEINVQIPVGWSNQTGFRHTWTANQSNILTTARQYLSRTYAPASIIISGQTWLNDTDDSDGTRIINAIKAYHTFRAKNPNTEKPNDATNKLMVDALSSGYTIASDRTAIINRIIARYPNRAIPTTMSEALNYLGILAQCKETRDRITRDAVNKSAKYNTATAISSSNVRAGMVGNWKTNQHTFIVSSVYWDANGKPTKIRVIDSNWGSGFNRPGGDIPWNRTMREHEETITWASHFEEF